MAIRAAALEVVVGANTTQAERGLKNFSSSLSQTARNLSMTGAMMTVGITAPIALLGKGMLDSAGNFEAGMNRVQALTNATESEFASLTSQAKELGATTQFSASQAADAMGFLGMAGFKADQILSAMPSTLQLASAANLDLGRAADITSNILTGYGMEVSELAHANDVLVAAFTSANTDLSQLGEAMKYAGPVASGMGMSFEEAAAAIGLMGNAGIQGSMAGTSLRNSLTALANPTKQQQKLMKALGVSLNYADDGTLLFTETLKQLEVSGASAEQVMALFGQRAGPAMLALLEQGSDALSVFTNRLRDSGGVAARVSAVQMRGLQGSVRLLKSAWEGFQIALMERGGLQFVTGLLERFATFVSRLTQSVGTFNTRWLLAGAAFVGVLAAAGPVLTILGALAGGLAFFLTPLGAVIAGVGALAVAVGLLGPELNAFARYLGLVSEDGDTLNDWLTHLPGFVQPAAQAVADMVLDLQSLWAQFQNLKDLPAGTITIGPITVAWTPEIKYINVGDVIQGIWTPEYSKIQIGDLIIGTWTPEATAINVGDLVFGVWSPQYKHINVDDLIIGTWVPNFTRIKVGDVFDGTWAPGAMLVKVGADTVFEGQWKPDIATIYAEDVIDGVWTPEVKALKIGEVITGIWTPEYKQISVGDLIGGTWTPDYAKIQAGDLVVGVWTPEIKAIDFGGAFKAAVTQEMAGIQIGSLFSGTLDLKERVVKLTFGDLFDAVAVWTPDIKAIDLGGKFKAAITQEMAGIQIGELLTGTLASGVGKLTAGPLSVEVTPEWNLIKAGPLTVTTIPKWALATAGPLTVMVTPKFTSVNIEDVIKVTYGLDKPLSILLGPDDFDLTAAIAAMQGKIVGLGDEIKAAWETGSWAGLGALAKTKITDIGTEITTGLSELVNNVKTGLLLGSLALSMFTSSEEFQAGVKTAADTISGGINTLLGGLVALSDVQWDVIGAVGPVLTGLATSVVSFANSVLGGIDTAKIATGLGNIATSISAAVSTVLDAEKLEGLGTAAGQLAGTFVAKLTEFLGTEGFGEQIGTSVINAAAALVAGAGALAGGIAGELANVKWGEFVSSINSFTMGFIEGVVTGLAAQDWSGVSAAIYEGIWEGVKSLVANQQQIEVPAAVLAQHGVTLDDVAQDRERTARNRAALANFGAFLAERARLWGDAIALPFEMLNENMQKSIQSLPDLEVPVTVEKQGFGAIAEAIIGYFTAAPPEIPVTPTIDAAATRRDALMDAILGGQVALEFPVTPKVDATFLDSLSILGAEPVPVPAFYDFTHGDLSTTDMQPTLAPIRAPVEILSFVVPDNIPALKAPVQVIDFIVPENVDLWASAAGIGSAITDAASQIEAPRFDWPALPDWEWPALPTFRWPEINKPGWVWNPIPPPSWLGQLQVPQPSWLGTLLSWSPVVTVAAGRAPTVPGQIGANAEGTDYWRGGLTWVGERGPELIAAPRGSRIYSNEDTMEMMRGGGGVTIENVNVYSDQDAEELAYKVAKIIERRSRGR